MNNPVEIKRTEVILHDGTVMPAEFLIWESVPENPEMIKLTLKFLDRDLSRDGRDYFSALVSIRNELEKEKILIKCYGCSKNVYSSPMSIDMGAGEKAYKLTIGQNASLKDVVWILDSDPDVIPVTIEEQREFFEEWTKSIAK